MILSRIAISAFPAFLFLLPVQGQTPYFQHHTVSTDLPVGYSPRFGSPALADFDLDGDLDFVLSRTRDTLYLFEKTGGASWIKRTIGSISTGQLGGAAFDVDRDGWPDVVTGGCWYRNPGGQIHRSFHQYHYDTTIRHEVHDMVFADVTGDGEEELVILGDRIGCFWYDIPGSAPEHTPWERHLITLDVLDEHADIHGGFFPGGVGDLDMDGDADLVLPGRWYRNDGNGETWNRLLLPFGSTGYWGLSARSWIEDMDMDGDNDIVMAGCDQVDSRVAWLENNGKPVPGFRVHLLPLEAPGRRGSFHSLWVADFDLDGDPDVFTMEQEDDSILPEGAPMKAFLWENLDGRAGSFREHVVLDRGIGGHDALFGDADGDGDLDGYFKIWSTFHSNGYDGKPHVDYLENLAR